MIEKLLNIFQPLADLIDELHTSEEERAKARGMLLSVQAKALNTVIEYEKELLKAKEKIITAEATGHSWLQRNWRPITMLIFVFLILYNHVIAPIFSLTLAPIPQDLWDVIKIGIGGYIVGRSVEKTVQIYRRKEE